MPTKAQYDDFVAKFKKEKPTEEEKAYQQFIEQFSSSKNSLMPILIFCVILQFVLYWLLYTNFTEDEWELNEIILDLPKMYIGACRGMVGMVLHIIIDQDFKQSLQLMKYALNHHWKFRRAGYAAFCVAFIQLTVAIITEFISITIICTSETFIDCVGNYVALACINDFDNNFFTYLSDHDVATLITEKKMMVGDLKVKLKDIFKVEVTSTYRPDESENDLVPAEKQI